MNVNIEQLKKILEKSKKINFESLEPKQLYEICKFPVTKINEKCYVSMNICCLGGCEFNDIEFETIQTAYEYAYMLTQLGIALDTTIACSECYAEYMLQNI